MTTGSSSASHLTGLSTALAGRYRLERELGAGGMATVYLAEDVRHGRRVAIKVLHPELSAVLGPERFLAEIRTTANLQHPHILPLFDSGSADGLLWYVMPFVDGETLRARLERERQLPLDDALRLATEVADALQYAHDRGVVHRDVKPDNVLLQGGRGGVQHALVADFGIALAVEEAGGARMTRTGLSLGTPQYMAPEQASGERSIDARADVYALGAVIYEMLAGEPPFTGPTARAVIARALTESPRSLAVLRPTVPPHVDAAVRRALQGLPADRFRTAAEFAAALAAPTAHEATPARAHGTSRRSGALLAAGALAIATPVAWAVGRSSAAVAPAPALVRFAIERDSGLTRIGQVAISPDGRTVVYVGESSAGSRLYARRLDGVGAEAVPGTDGATAPFFSPDGQSVAFVAEGALRRLRLAGDEPASLVAVLPRTGPFNGGAWLPGDTLVVFAGGFHRVSAAGGPLVPFTIVGARGTVFGPAALPGGRALAVTVNTSAGLGSVGILDLASGRLRMLWAGSGARYAAGHLLYESGGVLYARRFDVERLEPTGEPRVIARDIVPVSSTWEAKFDVAATGTVVYGPSGAGAGPLRRTLTLVDAAGRVQRTLTARMPWSPRYSPDGRRLAFGAYPAGHDSADVWLADLESGTTTRLTTTGLDANDPVWSPDGRQIAFDQLEPGGEKDLYVQPVHGGPARRLLRRPGTQWTTDWSPDGAAVLFTDIGASTGFDVWLQPVDGSAARPFLATAANEYGARVSPDGQWVAYESDESGRPEVYVQSYPSPGGKAAISAGGGAFPAWARDGRSLAYWQNDALVIARLERGDGGTPRVASRAVQPVDPTQAINILAMYDLAPSGRGLALVAGGERTRRLVVALGALADAR